MLTLKQTGPLKSNLNHTNPIKNKSDFCLTNQPHIYSQFTKPNNQFLRQRKIKRKE